MESLHISQNRVSIEIASPGDLTVEVRESYRERLSLATKHADIRVDKAKLMEHSKYFQKMFSGRWAEEESNTITLEEDTVKSMEVWFRLFHNTLSALSFDSIHVSDIWNIIMASDKYEFDRKYLAEWFSRWFEWKMAQKTTNPNDAMDLKRQLLFPCYSFNYAKGFQVLTRALAYESKTHIEELNPTRHQQMHLPKRVIRKSLPLLTK